MRIRPPKSLRFRLILNRTLLARLLLLGAVVLLGLGATNVVRWARRTDSIDYLSKKAFSEVRAYWGHRQGPDPQERWWPLFWRLSQESEQAETRRRAGNISLTMLANLERWDTIKELASGLEPGDPILERSFAVIGKAHLQSQGESAHISFLSRTIRSHPNPRLRGRAALALARLFIEQRRYQAANAVLSDFDWPSEGDDEDLEGWWRAARFELERLRPGMPSPPFVLRDAEERTIGLADLRGSPFVLLFWSPNCGPSSLLLEALYNSPPEGIQVLAVSPQPGKFDENPRQRPGFHFISDQHLAKEWNIYATPTALLFSRDGRLAGKSHAGGELATLIHTLQGKENPR